MVFVNGLMIIVIFVRQTWPKKQTFWNKQTNKQAKKWLVKHIIDKKKPKQTRIVCDLQISTNDLSICLGVK